MKLKSSLRHLTILAALLGGLFTARAADPNYWSWAQTPPMGWNSWDSFGAGIWQADALANADYMAANLESHGWKLITIDIQWYEPLAHTTEYRNGAILETDANGRLLPAPNRFPLTAETHSFKPIADYLHAKGLKFGLHLMRGIPRQAVDRDNAPILGTPYHAADIADKQHVCFWNTDMYGVDMSKPGAQEYYDSVFAQMADWGLDFVKVDDLAGHTAEIEAVRKAIDKCGRPIVFSISPGGSSVTRGEFVSTNANQWRISGDFWDSWGALYGQFARVDSWTPFRAPGHWPDADMIPFGNVRAWTTNGWTHFTHDEHYTLMTLWSIGRSPLILGGNLPKNDDFELSLLTNDEIISVNQNSENNRQLFNTNNQVAWIADVPGTKDKYLAVFNTSPPPPPGRGRRGGPVEMADSSGATNSTAIHWTKDPVKISVSLADLGITGSAKVRDLWTHTDLGDFSGEFAPVINSHGAGLYRVSPAQ
jgi:alpha-galactosidase